RTLSARALRRRRGATGGVTPTANANANAPRVRPADLDDWSAAQALFREGDDFHADIAPGYFRSGARPEAEWRQLLEDGCAVAFVAEVPGDGAVGLVTVRIYDTPDNPTMVPRRRGHVETLVVSAPPPPRGGGRRRARGVGERAAPARGGGGLGAGARRGGDGAHHLERQRRGGGLLRTARLPGAV